MKVISKDLCYSGIYCIINVKNNKRYVGSSINIRRRLWCHRACLRHNNHENPYLQNAWNKYKEEGFDFYIIEACDSDKLLEREQYYINTLKPEYNINLVAAKPPMSKESREKQSKTRKEKMATGEIPVTHNIPVYQYDLDGNYLNEYRSIR